jgi:hypothetical protein
LISRGDLPPKARLHQDMQSGSADDERNRREARLRERGAPPNPEPQRYYV